MSDESIRAICITVSNCVFTICVAAVFIYLIKRAYEEKS